MEEGDWGTPAALGEGEGSKRGLPGPRWVPPVTPLPQNWPTWKKGQQERHLEVRMSNLSQKRDHAEAIILSILCD